MLLLILPLGFFIAGLLVGHWAVVFAAVLTWGGIGLYLVINDGWYGSGWGDFGVMFSIASAVGSIGGSALGVAARRVSGSHRHDSAPRDSR
jgi:hypothetical protein